MLGTYITSSYYWLGLAWLGLAWLGLAWLVIPKRELKNNKSNIFTFYNINMIFSIKNYSY
ncbi:hypothetical protein BFL38_02740 [Brachyspira hampsonii]|uniref:Uncharacterized protein n=1 Tax=Brachyspira hampsonii TaxID=1287055 RepID=A0A1E5NC23_9SPIR|nr:hypothetical protein BFL38_02740 [Brachyspira hampsonii]